MDSFKYYSHGKLLLTGEYVVLDGALSLAIPTKFGQGLIIKPIEEPILHWKSLDHEGKVWFEGKFKIENNQIESIQHTNQNVNDRLMQILDTAKKLNPEFLNTSNGFEVTTTLEFPNNWGLGTSSTLINNISNWAKVDPYQLLDTTFGGSGYDIACASHDTPILYQLSENNPKERKITPVTFNPAFSSHLYFVHLNQKQDSREGIAHYKAHRGKNSSAISEISDITEGFLECDNLIDFETLLETHESIISKLTKQPTVKDRLFHNFNGAVKSLGAWGGDFIMLTSEVDPRPYLSSKGFTTVLPFSEMILK
ncbi:GYDIA family GHMP kinase [Mangrovimonas sp. DI 80]|uniref:GYDIA family GHMP kinase n=1 Tax=Mangrovimonas sp. DI 80 TaxID=1779330 RepID=UPI000977DED9|nr:GYDIA family GHMP kinase [Mangrovimonas sp. DI 80]OMP31837.1 GHMP kinase [Mangrovimonas sp. DI 80]